MSPFCNCCLICGSNVFFGEDSSLITSRKQLCLKFDTFVSRFLNLETHQNSSSTLNLKSTPSSVVCCFTCLPVVQLFCDTYQNWELLQLELFHTLDRISSLTASNKLQTQFVSKVEAKRIKNYPYLRLEKLPDSEASLNSNAIPIKSEITDEYPEESSDLTDDANDWIPKPEDVSDNNGGDESFTEEMSKETTLQNNADGRQCGICGKRFSEQWFLERHLNSHSETNKFFCNICESLFKTKKYLRIHKKKVHKVFEPKSSTKSPLMLRKCVMCDKIFERPAYLEHHLLIHHTHEKPFWCPVCHHEFTREISFKNHQKMYRHYPGGDKNFVGVPCKICGKVVLNMAQHLQKVHSSGSNNKVCDICGKSFGTKSIFERHLQTHSEERNYSCQFCSSNFKQPDTLKSHERLVHGTKLESGNKKQLHKCNTCSANFSS